MTLTRQESDTMGTLTVPQKLIMALNLIYTKLCHWLGNFSCCFIESFGILKKQLPNNEAAGILS